MDKSVPLAVALRHRIAAALRPMTEDIGYTVRSGLAAGLRRRGGLGFLRRQATEEEAFWLKRSGLLVGKTVYDAGSYEGIFSLFAARAVHNGVLVVFEPNSRSYHLTTRNLAENSFEARIITLQVGLGDHPESLTIAYPTGEPARASLDPEIVAAMEAEGGSMVRESVRVVRLDDIVGEEALPPPDVIKIDVEGNEYSVLVGAERTISRYRPELFLELHGANPDEQRRNQRRVHELLWRWDYRITRLNGGEIVELGEHLGHIYCTPQ